MKNKIIKSIFILAITGFILSLPILYAGYSAMWQKGTKTTVYADHIFTTGLFILSLSIVTIIILLIVKNIKKKL